MFTFIRSNPGLSSRFTRTLSFADYVPAELTEIFAAHCRKADLELDGDAEAAARDLFTRLYARRDAHFGNGRMARTQFETVIERQAARLMDDPHASTRII